MMQIRSKRSYIILSVAAALATMTVKFIGYFLTGSVGLFSDAAESVVNLAAALVALWAVTLAARPADEDHTYGHTKSEYFSSGVEGALILVAALVIAVEAIPRLLHPQPLEQVGLGLTFSVVGALINGVLAWFMLRAGKQLRSIALQADARHLLTDVWTTLGVLVGVALVALTGWLRLDPILALLVAANIIWTGFRLLHQTGLGLLDTALPKEDLEQINTILEPYRAQGLVFHALRSRQAGSRRFVSFHVLVPGSWTVTRGHSICEAIELAIRGQLPETTVFTHLEPREDPSSFADQALDRTPVTDESSGTNQDSVWLLRGVTSYERYVTRAEHSAFVAQQPPLGRPHATHAALLPIKKSETWWELTQDERRMIFEERSHHLAIGLRYLPAIARRLYHCHDLGEPFDFLTWFEYAPANGEAFEELVGILRQAEEWTYVEREIDIRLVADSP